MHVPRSTRRVAGALSLLIAVAAPGAFCQETVDVPGVFSEVIEVLAVDVEVVVTDAQGNRVSGLGREDFRITVDGRETPLDFWSEIRDGEALTPGLTADLRGDADGEMAQEGHSTSYLVFIDDSFTHARDRNLVLEKLADDLESLAPRDRMAVVAFDGRELTLLTAWTSSTRVLAGALRDARARPSGGADKASEHRLNHAHGGSTGGQLSGLQHRYALRLGLQIERAVMAAVASLRSFSSPPGRRVMLILGGAWPLSPAEFAISRGSSIDEALEDAYASGVLGYESLYGPLVDTANLLGYTLYPVDVAGDAGRIDPSTPMGLLSEGGDRSFWGPEGNLHAGMRYLAEKTGGRALVNDAREQALADAATDTRSYYWLGVRLLAAPSQNDSAGGAGAGAAQSRPAGDSDASGLARSAEVARHDLRVEVLRPGLVVRSREGFVDPSREVEMTMMSASALLFGTPASALAAQLQFGRPERAGRRLVKLPVRIGFPLDGIALASTQGVYTAGLALRLVAMDDEGSRIPPVLATIAVELARPPEPGEVYWHATELTLERRWHRVVAGIFDPSSGRIYSSAVEIAP